MTPKQLSDWRWRSFETLLAHVCKSKQPKEVLEWGPGHSTKIILATCPDSKILTIEHQQKYYQKFHAEFINNPNVEIVCRTLSMKGGHSTGYVNYPIHKIQQGGGDLQKYDLIFVDGRSRFDCLIAAKLMLKEGGVVLLHDAHRGNYLPAVKNFPHHKVFNELRTAIMSDKPMDFLNNFSGEINTQKSILESLQAESIPVEPVKSIPAKKSKVLSYDDTMADLGKRFASGDPFCYLRFGDADLFFIDNPDFDKNRRHDKNPAMAAELVPSFSLEHPDYLIGCVAGGKVFASKDSRLKAIAQKFHIGTTYHSAVALQVLYMQNPEGFVKFCKENFWGKRVLLIGGETVARDPLVKKAFNVTATIEFTDRNAYQMLDGKMAQIEKNIPKFDIMVSALGQATRVLGYRLWSKGLRTQYFDVGSAVDALAGKNHLRSWIKRVPELREVYNKAFFSEKE